MNETARGGGMCDKGWGQPAETESGKDSWGWGQGWHQEAVSPTHVPGAQSLCLGLAWGLGRQRVPRSQEQGRRLLLPPGRRPTLHHQPALRRPPHPRAWPVGCAHVDTRVLHGHVRDDEVPRAQHRLELTADLQATSLSQATQEGLWIKILSPVYLPLKKFRDGIPIPL